MVTCIHSSLKHKPATYLTVLLVFWCFAQPVNGAAPALGYGPLPYRIPDPGSYALPPIKPAADGTVLNTEGKPERLSNLLSGKYTLLSFIYTRCSDVGGCPLAFHVFNQIKTRMQTSPQLARDLQLFSLSFDPAFDTPGNLKAFQQNFSYAGKAGKWAFLTTENEASLSPLLTGFDQEIQKTLSQGGHNAPDFSHVLRVYLIDPEQQIRNIYSVGFLHADVLLADVETLMLESSSNQNIQGRLAAENRLSRPGDSKQGYESGEYQTDALALADRTGKPADLLGILEDPPLGLPNLPGRLTGTVGRLTGTVTVNRINLGRKLFYDRRLSLNDTFSCAMCHIPEQGFTNNELRTPVGVEGRTIRRNAPALFNTALFPAYFHDSRDTKLAEQIWSPLLARNEMANPSVGYVLNKIRSLPDYNNLFEIAFNQPLSMQTLGNALAAYMSALLSANSRFDRWFYGNESKSLDEKEQRGYHLFTGKAGCSACHTLNDSGTLFSDFDLHNTGIGFANSMGLNNKPVPVLVAPGITLEIDPDVIAPVSEPPPQDLGRYEITQNPADRWKYRTPSLRNISLTAPYMHDGSLGTLKDVIEFYNRGGIPNPGLSPLIRPLGLSVQEMDDLNAFLLSLTGSNVDELVADAFAAPVSDVGIRALQNKPPTLLPLAGTDTLVDKGKPTLLHFWATWCAPCREELPKFESLSPHLDNRGIALKIINVGEPENAVRQFLHDYPLSLPVILDPDGKSATKWQVTGFPSSVLVGGNGRILKRFSGSRDWDDKSVRAELY
ncbi:redoxin domain-containing protein [Parasalinivibrio latis]|uniref:cytochrome c peroxidase n=1 Tax=Parasalinivibrio latis TaxID=2952610 RepID=UPI0030E4472C